MFKKLLAAVGIGGTKVNTIVKSTGLFPGSPIEGEVHVQGGEVAQELEGLTLRLMTEVEVEVGDQEHRQSYVLAEWRLPASGRIDPGHLIRVPFRVELPWETPVTVIPGLSRSAKVWLKTGLAIDDAVDAGDHDELRIQPTPAMVAVMRAVEAAGFRPMRGDVEKGTLRGAGFSSTVGCYQELEYRPTGFGGGWRFKEIELSFIARPNQLHLLLEVDRTFGGDSLRSFTFPTNVDAETVSRQLNSVLR